MCVVVYQSNVFAESCRRGGGDDACGATAQNDQIKDHDFSLCRGPLASCSEAHIHDSILGPDVSGRRRQQQEAPATASNV
jgi:hypothetical protein